MIKPTDLMLVQNEVKTANFEKSITKLVCKGGSGLETKPEDEQ